MWLRDLARDAATARRVRHQHRVAAGERDVGRERCTFVAALLLDDLHQHDLPTLDHFLDLVLAGATAGPLGHLLERILLARDLLDGIVLDGTVALAVLLVLVVVGGLDALPRLDRLRIGAHRLGICHVARGGRRVRLVADERDRDRPFRCGMCRIAGVRRPGFLVPHVVRRGFVPELGGAVGLVLMLVRCGHRCLVAILERVDLGGRIVAVVARVTVTVAVPVAALAARTPPAARTARPCPVLGLLGPAFGLGLFLLQRLPVGDRDLVVVGMDLVEGEKAMPVAAVVDEGGLQRRLDPRHLCQVDVASEQLARRRFEIELLYPAVPECHNPGLLRVGGIDEHLVLVHCVVFLTRRTGPRATMALRPAVRNAPATALCSFGVEWGWAEAAAALGKSPVCSGCLAAVPDARPPRLGPFDLSLACMLSLRRSI